MSRDRPYVRKERPGTRMICACLRSKMLPYCDGTHIGLGVEPVMVNLAREETISWCGCGRSKDFPRCDGSHRSGDPPAG